MQSEQFLLYSWQTEDKFPALDHCQPQPTLTNAMLSSSSSSLPWTHWPWTKITKRQILSWFSKTCPYILSGFVFIGIRWSFVISFYKNTTFSRQFYRLDLSLYCLLSDAALFVGIFLCSLFLPFLFWCCFISTVSRLHNQIWLQTKQVK